MSDAIVDAINDLTRVIIATQADLTRSEVIRRLNALAIPSQRIAAILAMETKDVSSLLAKEKKKSAKNGGAAKPVDLGGDNAQG